MLVRRTLSAVLITVCALCMASARPRGAQQQGGQQGAPPAPSPAAPAPQTTPAGQQPTFRTGIDFVRVDVIATERGQPVTNLTEADFEVREDGKVQTIEQFRLVKVDGTARPGDPAPRQIRNRDDEQLEAARDDVRVIRVFPRRLSHPTLDVVVGATFGR